MKPQAENCLTGLRLMLRVQVGWTDAQEDLSGSVLKEKKRIKIYPKNQLIWIFFLISMYVTLS